MASGSHAPHAVPNIGPLNAEEANMNRPEPQPPIATALEQLKAAFRSIVRSWRARTSKAGGPEDRPDSPPPPSG